MTERIDHVAEANRLLSEIAPFQTQHLEVAMTTAQVHATLALVEQQRIANLIAIMAMALQGVGAGEHSRDEYVRLHQKINPQIVEVLGLNEGENDG